MRIIDNCLEKEYFDNLVATFCCTNENEGLPWWYGVTLPADPNQPHKDDPSHYFFTHLIYKDHIPKSDQYNFILPLVKEIEKRINEKDTNDKRMVAIKEHWVPVILRIRANLFPGTNTLHEYGMHADFPFSHTAAVLSLNTCDGYTKLADGTKADSVANRMVLFDAGEEHAATNTTNTNARINLIVNFL